jgi:hypothetical protein
MVKWMVLFACLIPTLIEAQDGAIVGTISDVQMGIPISNVNVRVEKKVRAISDSSGYYHIRTLSAGQYDIEFSHVGYETLQKSVTVISGQTDTVNIGLKKLTLMAKEAVVMAERDVGDWIVDKETPASYATLDAKTLEETHTTHDLPELIQDVPGVWGSSAGLGEANLNVRGFSGDQVNFFINGIPMNEPENRAMNWSDWSGLSSSVDAIQVIRGPMFTTQSSGAFGGAVQFETRSGGLAQKTRIRTSMGIFHTHGQVANGTGEFVGQRARRHQVLTFEHDTGPIWKDRVHANITIERKQGDSYVQGTAYDGWAFSLQATGQFKNHTLSTFFLGAPQTHDQAEALQDVDLLKTLGREYNQVNHIWRYDHAFRPVWSLQDQWRISKRYAMHNSVYWGQGSRDESRLINGVFDVSTGQVGFQPVGLLRIDYPAFGRHARYMYENFGVLMDGYVLPASSGDPHTFNNLPFFEPGAHLLTQQQDHSWQNVVHHSHRQVGFSSQLDVEIQPRWHWLVGGTGQFWEGNRKASAERIRVADITGNGQATLIQDLLDVFDYDTEVARLSGFARSRLTLSDRAKLYAGLQIASVEKSVRENPIAFFEFEESLAGHQYAISRERSFVLRTSADQVDALGQAQFLDADYKRHYWLTSPWGGLTVTAREALDVYANYAISMAEPAISDWYDPDLGPQKDLVNGESLVPEGVQNMELGMRYEGGVFNYALGYYRAMYRDKIESVVDYLDRKSTQNAGNALFQGVEFSGNARWHVWQVSGAFALSKNRWQSSDVQEVFGSPAADVVGKVVPFAPEQTAFVKLDYRQKVYGLGMRVNWWDKYYATFTNDYVDVNGITKEAKLPYFLDLGFYASYQKPVGKTMLSLRLNCNNVLNRSDNYQRAQLTVDSTRNDALSGKLHWYVLQSPLFHVFLMGQVAW